MKISARTWVGFCLAIFATITATYSSSAHVAQLKHAVLLYLPALYKDLVSTGGALKDWALPPTPYFFPDLLAYSALRIFSANHDWMVISAQVLMPTSVALLATYLARQNGSVNGSLQTLTLLSLMLLAYAWHWSGVAVDFLCFSNHGGHIVMTLLCLALMIRPTWTRVAVVCALSSATALSDPLFVMGTAVPISLLAVSQWHNRWAGCVKALVLLVSNLAGLAARTLLPVPAPPDKLFDSQRSAASLRVFVAHLGDTDTLPVYLWLVCAAVAVVLCWRHKQRRVITIALNLSILSTLFCLWLIGAEVVSWSSRYLVLVHVLLAILAPMGLQLVVKQPAFTKALAALSLAAATVTVVSLGHNISNIGRVRLSPIECFDRFMLDHPVHRCVATYWFAKRIAVLA